MDNMQIVQFLITKKNVQKTEACCPGSRGHENMRLFFYGRVVQNKF